MAVTPNVAPFINVTFWVTGQYGTVRPDHTHVGVDIATASAGGSQPLYSIFDGVVINKGETPARGNYIVVKNQNSGLAFLYQHMATPSSFNVGDTVLIGQQVGMEGNTGQSSGMHLHMEMQDLSGGRAYYFGNDISYFLNPCDYMGIPNVTGTECYYSGSPVPPTPVTREKRKFKWVLYARKLRNRGRRL